MRRALRYFFSFFLVVLIAPYVFGYIADGLGIGKTIESVTQGGWTAVLDYGYATIIKYGIAIVAGGALALWVQYFAEGIAVWLKQRKRLEISGKSYENAVIPLDGNSFKNCHFSWVVFAYNGGEFEFDRNVVYQCKVRTRNEHIDRFLSFLDDLEIDANPSDDAKVDQSPRSFKPLSLKRAKSRFYVPLAKKTRK